MVKTLSTLPLPFKLANKVIEAVIKLVITNVPVFCDIKASSMSKMH